MTMVHRRIASLEGRSCVVVRGAGGPRGLPLPGMPQLQVDMILVLGIFASMGSAML
jgi:hypothetical protein